ncbi:MAG: hypothetical protein FWG51_05490, partial [Firmicutes bacterium]|nr:hypothetical protein [Bacillota bacterium]
QTAPANQAPIISNEQQYAETVLPSSFQTEANYNDDFKKSEEPAIEEKPKETKPTEVQKELKEEEKEPVKQKEEDVSQPEEPKMESKRQDDTEEPIKFIRETKVVVVKEPDEEVLQAAKKELPDKEPEKKAEEHLESSPEPKEIIENKENKENKDKPVQSGIFARISGLKK